VLSIPLLFAQSKPGLPHQNKLLSTPIIIPIIGIIKRLIPNNIITMKIYFIKFILVEKEGIEPSS